MKTLTMYQGWLFFFIGFGFGCLAGYVYGVMDKYWARQTLTRQETLEIERLLGKLEVTEKSVELKNDSLLTQVMQKKVEKSNGR
jgi:hypothetical protein